MKCRLLSLNAASKLSNITTQIIQSNIKSLSSSYQSLISQINSAISAQRRLNALRSSSSSWYADWGYTGDGWKNEVAWVVHKWEYVLSQEMLKKMPKIGYEIFTKITTQRRVN